MMFTKPQWIWLDPKEYPEYQITRYNGFLPENDSYTVAEFTRTYSCGRMIRSVSLRFSGDTEYRLLCNGKLVATGPATIAGDFMCNDRVRPWHYATCAKVPVNSESLQLYARVKLCPCGINEYSRGHGGWMLSGVITFDDGSTQQIATDETWLARRDPRFVKPGFFDGRIPLPDYSYARFTKDIWQAETAPLLPRSEQETEVHTISAAGKSSVNSDIVFRLAGNVTSLRLLQR